MLHFTKRVGHLTGIVISEQDVAVQRLNGTAVTPTPQPLTPPPDSFRLPVRHPRIRYIINRTERFRRLRFVILHN